MVLVEPGDVVMTTLGDSFTGMTARAFDDAGNPVAGAMFDWSSSAQGIVEVFATAGDGSTATVRAVGAGTATISATTTTGGSGGVDVTVKPVTQLDVQPPAATISEFGPGGALGLTATAMDAGGNEVVEAEIEWSSSDPAIATVTTNGATSAVDGLAAGARVSNATVEGVADGVVTITAKVVTRDVEAQGAEGTSTVTVQVVNTVEVTPTSSTITELGVAGVVELTALARDALGSVIPNLAYEWSSSDDAIASVNATGDGSTADVTGNAAGMVTITATTDDVSGTSDITVDPGPPGLIVFTTEFVGDDEIHSINPDGTGLTQLTFNTVKDDEPSLSGDGTKIGFRSERQGNNANIFIMNVDGSSPLQLTFSGAHDDEPSVSTDGTRIVFYSDRASGPDSEVYVVATDGIGAPVQLTNNSAADDDPDWSPDGTQIVFRSDRDGQDEIYIMNDDGTGQTRLTFNGASDNKPSWSPLGDRIVFETNRNGVDDIYTMKTDGTDLVRVTDQSGDDEEPVWSPDAR